MTDTEHDYDPRYLAGIVLFNRGDFFEAHEVWEELWGDTPGPGKSYYQGLIQAAVALCHYCNGNVRGAVKLFRTARQYMAQFASPHQGLDIAAFWLQMERCFAPLLAQAEPPRAEPDPELFPTLILEPAPAVWPDPALSLHPEEEP